VSTGALPSVVNLRGLLPAHAHEVMAGAEEEFAGRNGGRGHARFADG